MRPASTPVMSCAAILTQAALSKKPAGGIWISCPQLQEQKDDGDTVGYVIDYAIDVATDGGAYQEVLKTAADGKTTTKYERSHRIDLPKAHSGWQVRVRRLTPKQTTNRIADAMVVEAITEVIESRQWQAGVGLHDQGWASFY